MTSVGLGFFPWINNLNYWEAHWSEGLAKEATWLKGVLSGFKQAEETFAWIGPISMSDNTIWRRAERWGKALGRWNKNVKNLVGIAPFNHDSGKQRDKRRIFGGRTSVRSVLYMATYRLLDIIR